MLRAATLKENGLPAELPQFAYPQRICVRRLVDAKMAHFMRSFGLCTPKKKRPKHARAISSELRPERDLNMNDYWIAVK